MKALNALRIAGQEVLPVVEGGKGMSVSNGESSGAWADAGGEPPSDGAANSATDHPIPASLFLKAVMMRVTPC